jgi:hypothetical protein
MAGGKKVLTELDMVVNLAVTDNRNGFIFVRDGLVSAFNVDNAQAPHPKANALPYTETFAVRSAVV